MANVQGISAFPEGDNLFHWVATVGGPMGTPYEGLTYKLTMRFPQDYPYTAPLIHFDTPIFHPNVDEQGGAICLDILKEKWSPVYNVQTILLSLQSLLGEPNNDSPLNPRAAAMWPDQDGKQATLASPRPQLV